MITLEQIELILSMKDEEPQVILDALTERDAALKEADFIRGYLKDFTTRGDGMNVDSFRLVRGVSLDDHNKWLALLEPATDRA